MKITFHPDPEIVKSVQEGLKRTGGYCPCMIQRSEDVYKRYNHQFIYYV